MGKTEVNSADKSELNGKTKPAIVQTNALEPKIKKETKKGKEQEGTTIKELLTRDDRSQKNTVIIIVKVVAACLLFFCCCVFFFQNMNMFWRDFISPMFWFPVLYFGCIVFICVYMSLLMGSIEDDRVAHSDRFDLVYKIVFTVAFLLLAFRSLIGDWNNPDIFIGSNLNVQWEIIVPAMISGFVTWFTPKIKDNDSSDF